MGAFTKITQSAFEELQVEAGVLLSDFNPASPSASIDNSIITATTGGIQANCIPQYSDFFADVDNAPNNTKEGKHLDGWDCNFSFTAIGVSPEVIQIALGAADTASSKVTPRRDLEQTDFDTIWWVGDRADGGFVAIKLINALSTGGFALQTTKAGKGQLNCTITGHASIANQDVVPMEFYSMDPSA